MNERKSNHTILKPAIFLTILICLIYSNTLNCAWQLDDYHNITKNSRIQIHSLTPDTIKNSFYAAPNRDELYRPLAYFSLALNWLWGGDNVTGYHVVNIAIHIFTALILFLTIQLLLRTPNLRGLDENRIYFVALLSAVLWAIHPIQIQAVTYIVQRMASMAALFYIIGVFCYLKARMSFSSRYRICWWGGCGLAFLLGIGSKNNAIMLPVILLLMEFIFFRDLGDKKMQRQAAIVLFTGGLLVAAAGFFIFMKADFGLYFKELYEVRPFSAAERLMTQPRVVLFYLFQIFYPVAEQFSVAHDFPVSTSLLAQWTTLPAIIIVTSLIIFAVWRIKKNPILSFAIFFYFGNHLIESTIVPLEMVFEHRNYLPTLFLFVPVSIGIKKALDYYYPAKKPMFYFLIFSISVGMIGLGTSTYIRNWDWRTPKSLWEDAAKKAPQSARPLHNLAYGYYEPTGQIEKALALYEKALELKDDQTIFKADIYNNYASIYYLHLKEYEKAIDYAKKALEIFPLKNSNFILCDSLCMLSRYDQALMLLNELQQKNPDNVSLIYRKGFILLKTGKPSKALDLFKHCARKVPSKSKYLREIGFCLTRMENYKMGYWFLKRAKTFNPKQAGILLGLADNRVCSGHFQEAAEWLDQLVNLIGAEKIEQFLNKTSKDPMGLPVCFKELAPLVSKKLFESSEEHKKTADRLKKQFSNCVEQN